MSCEDVVFSGGNVSSVCKEQLSLHQQPGLICGFHGNTSVNNSIRCNTSLTLEAPFGYKRCQVGAVSPLFGDFIYITFIYVYILGNFYCIRFPYYLLNGPVFVRVSIAAAKSTTKASLGGKGLAYTSTSLVIIKGSQDMNSKQSRDLEARAGEVLFTVVLLMACSACFLIGPSTSSPEITPPTMDCALSHQTLRTLQSDLI